MTRALLICLLLLANVGCDAADKKKKDRSSGEEEAPRKKASAAASGSAVALSGADLAEFEAKYKAFLDRTTELGAASGATKAAAYNKRNDAKDELVKLGPKITPLMSVKFDAADPMLKKEVLWAMLDLNAHPSALRTALKALEESDHTTVSLACELIGKAPGVDVEKVGPQMMIATLRLKKDGKDTDTCEQSMTKLGFAAPK